MKKPAQPSDPHWRNRIIGSVTDCVANLNSKRFS